MKYIHRFNIFSMNSFIAKRWKPFLLYCMSWVQVLAFCILIKKWHTCKVPLFFFICCGLFQIFSFCILKRWHNLLSNNIDLYGLSVVESFIWLSGLDQFFLQPNEICWWQFFLTTQFYYYEWRKFLWSPTKKGRTWFQQEIYIICFKNYIKYLWWICIVMQCHRLWCRAIYDDSLMWHISNRLEPRVPS